MGRMQFNARSVKLRRRKKKKKKKTWKLKPLHVEEKRDF
jgi:hypothetical protein